MKLRALVRIGIGVLMVAAAAWSALNPEAVSLQDLQARLSNAGRWAPIAFMAGFAAAILRAEGIGHVQLLCGGMEARDAQDNPGQQC